VAPASGNPLNSASPSASLDLINRPGDPLYFLTGTNDGAPINRTATIRAGQAVFFPIVNLIEWQNFAGSDTCTSPASLLSGTQINSIYATLNGVALAPVLSSYRQSCAGQPDIPPAASAAIDGAFQITSNPASYLASLGQTGTDLYASDGYWLLLEPLAPGSYDLSFGGSFTLNPNAPVEDRFTFTQANNYRLNIQAEVPGPLPLLGAARAAEPRRNGPPGAPSQTGSSPISTSTNTCTVSSSGSAPLAAQKSARLIGYRRWRSSAVPGG
jgi:hypothetical protein